MAQQKQRIYVLLKSGDHQTKMALGRHKPVIKVNGVMAECRCKRCLVANQSRTESSWTEPGRMDSLITGELSEQV